MRSCGVELSAKDVHRGVRKIFDAAGVVKIEMGQHDVAHIGGAEAQLFDLPQSGIGLAQPDAIGNAEEGAQSSRLRHVARAEPGIDEHQPDFGFDQKAVADDLCGSENRAMTVP